MSIRDEIFAAADIVRVPVAVPEWGGRAHHLQTLTSAERDAWEMIAFSDEEKDPARRQGLFRAALVVFSMVDEKGSKVFDLSKAKEEARTLATKSAAAVERLYRVAARLSMVEEKDVAELAKN